VCVCVVKVQTEGSNCNYIQAQTGVGGAPSHPMLLYSKNHTLAYVYVWRGDLLNGEEVW